MSRRLAWMTAALVVALGLQTYGGGGKLPAIPMRDYVEYWAAGQLLARGGDPYDQAEMARLQERAGREEAPIPMLNPPWTMPLVLPLGWLDARAGHLLWLGLNLLAIVASADLLWRTYGGDPDYRVVAVAVALTFFPALGALLVGQISPLLLLGAALFLRFVRDGRDLEAGVASTLLAVKPHLAYLFWVALVVWAVGARRWKLLAGGALAGAVLTATAAAFRPTILADYWAMARRPPAEFAPPTWGYVIRLWLDSPSFAWQYLPMLPGFGWLAWYAWRNRRGWDWPRAMPYLLLASALTAAYGAWLFDLVILLVPVIAAAARLREKNPPLTLLAAGAHLALLAACLALALMPAKVEYLHYIWVTPAVLAAYVGLDLARPRGYSHLPRT